MKLIRASIGMFLLALFVGALFFGLLYGVRTSARAQEDTEDEVKAMRQELPDKCPCGCGRDFLDCDHDCKALDTISTKDRKEIVDPVPMRLEVPRDKFPTDEWVYGALVTVVFKGTPARKGSTKPKGEGNRVILESGDIITHINGEPVKTMRDYYELMGGNSEKRVTVIDWRAKTVHNDYFRPADGRIGIKFQPIRLKVKPEE